MHQSKLKFIDLHRNIFLSPSSFPNLLKLSKTYIHILKPFRSLFVTVHPEMDDGVFDENLGQIVNIIVTYDMSWSKRGNGRNYDSLNGYSVIIGFVSGKILDYATRNRKCRKCDKGHSKEDHDCRLNFEGSAKAMEADAGVELINRSTILKEAGLQVRVFVGDEDSSLTAAIRKDNPSVTMYKLADKNHLEKNVSNELYKMCNTYKELNKKGVISHIKKCFSYAVAQNKGDGENLAIQLKKLPDHLFGSHENCGKWCNSSKSHTVQLKDQALYEQMVIFFEKYATNAHKFSVAASSQANESLNNIIANKAHKSKCLSTSASCDFRVADSVCVKNDGKRSILNVQNNAGIPIGTFTSKFAIATDRKRFIRAEKSRLKSKKLRRLELKNNRENLRKKKK